MCPASIASALTHPASNACKPNSPYATALPRLALPFSLPRWFFRNFTRLGMSGIGTLLGIQIIPVVDPNLDTDVALRGRRLGGSIFHASAQRRQRNATQHRAFLPGHFPPPQPSPPLHAHTPAAPFPPLCD